MASAVAAHDRPALRIVCFWLGLSTFEAQAQQSSAKYRKLFVVTMTKPPPDFRRAAAPSDASATPEFVCRISDISSCHKCPLCGINRKLAGFDLEHIADGGFGDEVLRGSADPDVGNDRQAGCLPAMQSLTQRFFL